MKKQPARSSKKKQPGNGTPRKRAGKPEAPPVKAFVKPKMGRPIKLTPKIQDEICTALAAGSYIETAAAFCGVHKSTLFDWLKKGADQEAGIYRDFSDAVEKAMSVAELRDLTTISKAAESGWWQAAAWRLERRHPDKWGRRIRNEHSSPGSDKVEHNLDASGVMAIIDKIYGGDPEPDQEIDPEDFLED